MATQQVVKVPPLAYAWESDEYINVQLSERLMEFRLLYGGPLHSSQNDRRVNEKQAIRRAFHEQLSVLWKQHSALKWGHPLIGQPPPEPNPEIEVIANRHSLCGYRFVPLVREAKSLVCELDILFLRRGDPGALVSQAGDVDRRVTTLLDALRIPENCDQLPKDSKPGADEDPFFCLLENDSLITALKVETDRLLSTVLPPEVTGLRVGHSDENNVLLVVRVEVKATRLGFGNIDLVVTA
jgi:hypothetical protein